ncbi:helix-turn-helix domain-containing protein [Methanocaldococcus sp. 16A]
MKDFIINRLKKFTIEDLMRCILGLQEIEIKVYFDLLENGEGSVLEIAERVNRDRTTVQKALRSLMNCGLVNRKKVTEKVGYKYIYNAVELDKVSDIIEELLDDWYQNVKKWLNYFRESRYNEKNY